MKHTLKLILENHQKIISIIYLLLDQKDKKLIVPFFL